MAAFEKALIKVEREKEFGELKSAITRIFAPRNMEKFLKRLQSDGIRVRDWDAVLEKRELDREDEVLKKSGTTAEKLYQALTVSDQAQMREFYLSQLEHVDPELRTKFRKLYQYY
jgi:hypothetical protein